MRDNGKEHGNYRDYWGYLRDNGKENGNYYDFLPPVNHDLQG